jgi:hypothetical protein
VIQEKDPRGVGVFSSRRLARATYEDVAFRVLAAGAHPHFTRINAFRLEHREVFQALFIQGLRMCAQAGLVKLGHVSLDGAKILANASKHKAMSYKRMKEVDREEDALYGEGRSGYEVPEELRRRETRRARIAVAKAARSCRPTTLK